MLCDNINTLSNQGSNYQVGKSGICPFVSDCQGWIFIISQLVCGYLITEHCLRFHFCCMFNVSVQFLIKCAELKVTAAFIPDTWIWTTVTLVIVFFFLNCHSSICPQGGAVRCKSYSSSNIKQILYFLIQKDLFMNFRLLQGFSAEMLKSLLSKSSSPPPSYS